MQLGAQTIKNDKNQSINDVTHTLVWPNYFWVCSCVSVNVWVEIIVSHYYEMDFLKVPNWFKFKKTSKYLDDFAS